jgi:hypothetical protein
MRGGNRAPTNGERHIALAVSGPLDTIQESYIPEGSPFGDELMEDLLPAAELNRQALNDDNFFTPLAMETDSKPHNPATPEEHQTNAEHSHETR